MQNGHCFILDINAQKPVLFETKNEQAQMESLAWPKILIQSPDPGSYSTDLVTQVIFPVP